MSPETPLLGTSTWRSADPCLAPDSCLGLLGAEWGSISQSRPPTTLAAGQWEGSHAIHRETGPAHGAGPPCPQPHPPYHSPRPTRPWPHTSIHQGHSAQVLALSLSPSHQCPLPSCLPQSGTYTPTVGCRASQQLTRGASWGLGLQWVESVGSEPHLRNTIRGLGGGHLVGSARSAALGASAQLAMPRSASGQPPRLWKHNGASRPCHRLIGGGGNEPGALQGHVPMGAKAHNIGDPSALVFGAGHE